MSSPVLDTKATEKNKIKFKKNKETEFLLLWHLYTITICSFF